MASPGMAVAPGERDGLANILFEATLAGARALAPLWRKTVNVAAKADGSLVSAADHAADDAVRRALAEAALGWPLVSEESHEPGQRPPDRYLLLDPSTEPMNSSPMARSSASASRPS